MKRTYSTLGLYQEYKKPKYEIVIHARPEQELKLAIQLKKINIIEDLIMNQNISFETDDINQHKILHEAIYHKKYLLAQKLITPTTTLCPAVSEIMPLNLSTLFGIFLNAEFYIDQHIDTLVDKLIEHGVIQEEESLILQNKIITTSFRMLVGITHPHKNETLTKFIHTTLIKMLEAGCNPLLLGSIPKEIKTPSLHSVKEKIIYAEILNNPLADHCEHYNVLRNCFDEGISDFALKIALSRKNIDLLWSMNTLAHKKRYTCHERERFFIKPNYPHYCTHECKLFLPMFNFMRRFNDLKTDSKMGDIRFKFR